MAECKHELKHLVGMADGIHCKACGAVFKSMEEIRPAKPVEKSTENEAPKKEVKKNARRK